MQQGLALLDAMRDAVLARHEAEHIARRLAPQEQRRHELLALMANFVPVRQQWQELTDKIQDQQKELGKWAERLGEVQMTLAAEVAKRRTHLSTVQVAQQQILPTSPRLLPVFLWAAGIGVAMGLMGAFLPIRRPRLPRWLIPTLAAIILIVAAFLSAMSITLRLTNPDLYVVWREAPFDFLYQHGLRALEWLSRLF